MSLTSFKSFGLRHPLGALVALGLGSTASGAVLDFSFDIIRSGDNPSNPPPWIKGVLRDLPGDHVEIILVASGLAPTEFLTEFHFNLDPLLDPTDLTLESASSVNTVGIPPDFDTGADAFNDAGSLYDIRFQFPTANTDGRFQVAESVSLVIGGIPGLDAFDFVFRSIEGGGPNEDDTGPYALAHIEGIDPEGSAKVAVGAPPIVIPEASTVVAGLGLMGALAAGSLVRRRRA